jgi:arylsulfatase A
MKRLALPLLCCAVMTTLTKVEAAPSQPNIILIYTDDVGIGEIGCYGAPFSTPRIDSLATNGMRFEYCYSTPLCGPSRCQTLTGRYPFRTGLNSNQSAAALAGHTEIMIPTVMKQAGYVTACVGKWGQMPYGPGQWGFDEWMSGRGSGRYRPEQKIEYERNGKWRTLQEGEYLPDLMHDFVVSFIEKHQAQPFFLYYPMEAIHGPILRTPDSKPDADQRQLYRDNVEYMDKTVGKLLDELDRLKIREKTLVIFTGDNGTARFGLPAQINGRQIFGQKGQLNEGGCRVPLLVSWPGTTPVGKVSSALVDFSDFFATFAELGGAQLPEGVTLDSHSFAPQIKNQNGTPREWVYVELNGRSFVRDARYKLTNRGEFFDLKNAPFEEIPVPADTTDSTATAARQRLQQVLDEHPTAPGIGGKAKQKAANKRARAKRKLAVPKVS